MMEHQLSSYNPVLPIATLEDCCAVCAVRPLMTTCINPAIFLLWLHAPCGLLQRPLFSLQFSLFTMCTHGTGGCSRSVDKDNHKALDF